MKKEDILKAVVNALSQEVSGRYVYNELSLDNCNLGAEAKELLPSRLEMFCRGQKIVLENGVFKAEPNYRFELNNNAFYPIRDGGTLAERHGFALRVNAGNDYVLLSPGGMSKSLYAEGDYILNIIRSEKYKELSSMNIFENNDTVIPILDLCHVITSPLLFSDDSGEFIPEDGTPVIKKTLDKYMASAGAFRKTSVIENGTVNAGVCPKGLFQTIKTWGLSGADKEENRLYQAAKEFDRSGLNSFSDKPIVAVAQIAGYIQGAIDAYKDEMTQYICNALGLYKRKDETSLIDVIESVNTGTYELRPRIVADSSWTNITTAASWLEAPSVNEDGSFNLKFPFKMRSEMICRAASAFLAAKMPFAGLMLPLWYEGAVKIG